MTALVKALGRGDPREVADIITRGHDIRYQRDHGYTALLDAVHGRDISRDPRLLELIDLLVGHGATLDAVSSYHESALRVLSRVGRFDAVQRLLDAGADASQLAWTPLMHAVALGSLADVERELSAGAALEAMDWWHRTALAIALVAGDAAKAACLFERGASADVCGRLGPALFYAIDGHQPALVRWLLEIGADVDQMDASGITALMHAADVDDVACAGVLIAAGAEVDRYVFGTALGRATSRAMVERLLAAGADPSYLSQAGQRSAVGLPPDPDVTLLTATAAEFARASARRFGAGNPEPMNEPFWLAMIRSGIEAYGAGQTFGVPRTCPRDPVWCAHRFGQSLTFLPDGRIVQIGGEHEDFYDPDFCIYNDVFVHSPGGAIAIYGYPRDVFPPTDFHTATRMGNAIVVIGALGYQGTRGYGTTPVFRLDLATFRMERVETTGEGPAGSTSTAPIRPGRTGSACEADRLSRFAAARNCTTPIRTNSCSTLRRDAGAAGADDACDACAACLPGRRTGGRAGARHHRPRSHSDRGRRSGASGRRLPRARLRAEAGPSP